MAKTFKIEVYGSTETDLGHAISRVAEQVERGFTSGAEQHDHTGYSFTSEGEYDEEEDDKEDDEPETVSSDRLDNILGDAQYDEPDLETDDVLRAMLESLRYPPETIDAIMANEEPVFDNLLNEYGVDLSSLEVALRHAIGRARVTLDAREGESTGGAA